ncbi:hypothetical protein UY3_03858 [Chelonia mydas]|uniref:Uncharacterized protein n=1 Tax=Chelonia mydas TaxID=8469 RepID=M7BLZ7_CHEMY|nr:hypothetical protein UY3_03858 [Chelonia mydas]
MQNRRGESYKTPVFCQAGPEVFQSREVIPAPPRKPNLFSSSTVQEYVNKRAHVSFLYIEGMQQRGKLPHNTPLMWRHPALKSGPKQGKVDEGPPDLPDTVLYSALIPERELMLLPAAPLTPVEIPSAAATGQLQRDWTKDNVGPNRAMLLERRRG